MRKVIGSIAAIALITYFLFGSAPFVHMAKFAQGFGEGMTGQVLKTDQNVLHAATQARSPDFRVGRNLSQEKASCRYNPTGTQCLQYDYQQVTRLTIQSANDYPLVVKEVVINEKNQCSVQPNMTMTLGDTYQIPLGSCDPIKVRIVTDHGEAIYRFGN